MKTSASFHFAILLQFHPAWLHRPRARGAEQADFQVSVSLRCVARVCSSHRRVCISRNLSLERHRYRSSSRPRPRGVAVLRPASASSRRRPPPGVVLLPPSYPPSHRALPLLAALLRLLGEALRALTRCSMRAEPHHHLPAESTKRTTPPRDVMRPVGDRRHRLRVGPLPQKLLPPLFRRLGETPSPEVRVLGRAPSGLLRGMAFRAP